MHHVPPSPPPPLPPVSLLRAFFRPQKEWHPYIKTRARGRGKPCPDDLAPLRESRPCAVDCPVGAPTPTQRTPRSAHNAITAEVVSAEKSALERSGGGGEQGANIECERGYSGVWGPCGKTCEQTRYAEDGCAGRFEVRFFLPLIANEFAYASGYGSFQLKEGILVIFPCSRCFSQVFSRAIVHPSRCLILKFVEREALAICLTFRITSSLLLIY